MCRKESIEQVHVVNTSQVRKELLLSWERTCQSNLEHLLVTHAPALIYSIQIQGVYCGWN